MGTVHRLASHYHNLNPSSSHKNEGFCCCCCCPLRLCQGPVSILRSIQRRIRLRIRWSPIGCPSLCPSSCCPSNCCLICRCCSSHCPSCPSPSCLKPIPNSRWVQEHRLRLLQHQLCQARGRQCLRWSD